MIKKLIVAAMFIVTLGIGNLAYTQATGGSSDRRIKTSSGKRHSRQARHRRRHRVHRSGGTGRKGRKT